MVSATPPAASATNSRELRSRLLPWICLALFVLAFAPTVAWLCYRWTLGIWYTGHAGLVPAIVAYLAYQELRKPPFHQPTGSAWGFVLLVPSTLLLVFDSAMGTQLLAAIALVLALPGLSLLLLGTAWTKRLVFPLLIAWFMLPIPADFLTPINLVLRHVSAWAAAYLVPLFGIPVYAEGTLLQIPGTSVLVADACSGFSTLYAALMTALILAHWSSSTSKKMLLFLSAPLLTLLCNSARVTILVLLIDRYGSELLKTPIHETTGVVTFVAVLAALFALAGRRALRGATG